MRLIALVALAVVAMTLAAACGSSHGQAGPGGAIEIHLPTPVIDTYSASSHHSSVRQVEAAFASQGIHLHKVNLPEMFKQLNRGEVFLRYGRAANFVSVVTGVRPPRSDSVQFFGTDRRLSVRPRFVRLGHMIVIFDPAHTAAVEAALAELH